MRRWGLVAAAAVGSHLTALGGGLVWLDHAHLEGGAALAPPARFFSLFTHGFAGTGYYRPLMSLSLSFDALVGGARVFHATSLAWHALAAVMTMVAGGALGLSRRAALFAGILFAVHPLTSVVADAIAFRSEAMAAASLLVLIWAHLRARPVVAAAALAAGALTKETALVLAPLFIVALELERRRSSKGAAVRLDRRLLLAEAGALGLVVLLRLAYAPPWRAAHVPLSAGDAIGTRLAGLAKSTAALVMPIDRTLCDAFPITHGWQLTAIAGAAVAVVVALLAWRRRGAALLLALALLPALQLVPVARWWSPHYLYLPLVFVAMQAAAFAERLGPRMPVVVGGVAIVLGGVTLADGRRYQDDTTLWTPEVRHQPACREGHFYLGEVERSARRWDAAARRYEAALAPRPGMLAFVDRAAALQNLGTVRVEQGRFAEAQRAYRTALEGANDEQRRRELTHNLAAATLAGGDPGEAIRLLEPETARAGALPDSIRLHAMALRKAGRPDEAERLLERVPAP